MLNEVCKSYRRLERMEILMIGWKVFFNGKHIDTVFYTPDCSHDYVKTSLIEHDGYPQEIKIYKDK